MSYQLNNGYIPVPLMPVGAAAADADDAAKKKELAAKREEGKKKSPIKTKGELAEYRAKWIRIISFVAAALFIVVGGVWTFDWGYSKENIRILFISIPLIISGLLYFISFISPGYTKFDVGTKGGVGSWLLTKSWFGRATIFTLVVPFFIGYAYYLGLFLPVYHEYKASDFPLFGKANGCDMMRCGMNTRCLDNTANTYNDPYQWDPTTINLATNQSIGEAEPDRYTKNVGCECRLPGEAQDGPAVETNALTKESISIPGCIPERHWSLEVFQIVTGYFTIEPKTNKARRGVFARCSVFLCPRTTGLNTDGSLKGELQYWNDSARVDSYRTFPLVMIIAYFAIPGILFFFLMEQKYKDTNIKGDIVLKKGAPMMMPPVLPAPAAAYEQHQAIGAGDATFGPILEAIPFVRHRTALGGQLVDM